MTEIKPKWYTSIKDIPYKKCKQLFRNQIVPFYEIDWLIILENSASVCRKTGWQPVHLILWKGEDVIAFAPLYLKSHSYGEFIFDQAFVRLASEFNLKYYPKLIGMSPFSPIEGYKFIIDENECEKTLTNLMIDIIDQFAIENKIVSCNFIYADPKWIRLINSREYRTWLNKQSLWEANGKKDFEDYLADFNANQRRNIKRERKSITQKGIKVSAITGSGIDQNLLMLMHDFYQEHCSRWGIWGSKYLSKDFFRQLALSNHLNHIVLFVAHRDDVKTPIAMSMCIKSQTMLWGRYWGSSEEIENLHFEVCYYSPISWALKHGIQSFDPGAGGGHKQRRGFITKPNTSIHRWYDKRMDQIISDWLPKTNEQMLKEIEAINFNLPFKANQPNV